MTVLENTKTHPVIVDIGANIGVTVQHFRNYGKVYAVEPSQEHFEALKKNKEFNGWDNVEIFNYAIADKDGKMTFTHNPSNLTCNSLVVDYKDGIKETVKTKSLMSFFKEAGITHVDFMKLDVEGGEDLILPSKDFEEASKMIDCLEIEFHFPTFTQHVNHLIKMGYKARRYTCSACVIAFTK